MTEIHLLFYQSCLQIFVHFNTFLQREDPLVPVVYEQMISFLTKLASKFVPVAAVRIAKGDFFTLNYKDKDDQVSGNSVTKVGGCSRIVLVQMSLFLLGL